MARATLTEAAKSCYNLHMNYTYILKCSDGTLYTGWTNNLEKRLLAHNNGKGCKYTHARCPVELVYVEHFETKQEAQSREALIKHLSRAQKQALIDSATPGGVCVP